MTFDSMPLDDFEKKLLALIRDKHLAAADELVEIEKKAQVSRESLDELLLSSQVLDEKTLAQLKGQALDLPYIDLSNRSIPRELLELLPPEAAQNYQIVPFDKIGSELRVAMADPRDYKALEALQFLAQKEKVKIAHYITNPSSFNKALKQRQSLGEEIEEVIDVAKTKFTPLAQGGFPEGEEEIIKRAPVSKIVSVIIRHAVEGGASDVHIEPLPAETRVRYRIDGILHTSLRLPQFLHEAIVSRIKILARLKIDETRIPQDGRFRLKINEKEIDFRISVLPLRDAEKVVMRILDVSQGAPSLEDLGLPESSIKLVRSILEKPVGMILVTGPTGSGKSTTIFSMLNILNKEGVNIVTLEDPIEYYLKGVSQAQIRPEVGFNFATGLRAVLRQDPNIIMVGEIRDRETAELAIHAGLTGHLVLSTLHTNDALGAIPRLIDMKIEPFLLASALNMVMAQRLVRRICLKCKSEERVSADLAQKIQNILSPLRNVVQGLADKLKEPRFYRGKGCAFCGGVGYKGRMAIVETLSITEEMKEIIMNGGHRDSIKGELARQQFVNLQQNGFLKVLDGLSTVEEVLRVTEEG